PEWLEEPIGEPESQDVLRGLFAQKMVDPEDLLFLEYLVQARIERHGARQIGAERLFHDDAGSIDEIRFAEGPDRRERRIRRHAQVVEAPALPGESRLHLV